MDRQVLNAKYVFAHTEEPTDESMHDGTYPQLVNDLYHRPGFQLTSPPFQLQAVAHGDHASPMSR